MDGNHSKVAFIALRINDKPRYQLREQIWWSASAAIATHSKYTFVLGLASIVAFPTMPLVHERIHALSSAALLRVVALLLACPAVLLIGLQINTFVVAACGVCALGGGANLVVLVAVVGCSGVLLIRQEAAPPLGGERWDHRCSTAAVVSSVEHRMRGLFFFCDVSGAEKDGHGHGCGYHEDYFHNLHGCWRRSRLGYWRRRVWRAVDLYVYFSFVGGRDREGVDMRGEGVRVYRGGYMGRGWRGECGKRRTQSSLLGVLLCMEYGGRLGFSSTSRHSWLLFSSATIHSWSASVFIFLFSASI